MAKLLREYIDVFSSGDHHVGLTRAIRHEEPPLYQIEDWVWMVNYRRRRRPATKLQPKFVGPYAVVEVMPNHTYKIEHSVQLSIQNKAHLKPYWVSPDTVGEAPRCWSPGGRQRHSDIDQSMKWSCRGQKTWQKMRDRFHLQKHVYHFQRRV